MAVYLQFQYNRLKLCRKLIIFKIRCNNAEETWRFSYSAQPVNAV